MSILDEIEIASHHQCADKNPKIRKRIFKWTDYFVEFSLCKECILDPDFQGFIFESDVEGGLQN